jgi:hypothetical protein
VLAKAAEFFSLQNVNGGAVSGGVFDLQVGSPELNMLANGSVAVPTAMIAGQEDDSNLANVGTCPAGVVINPSTLLDPTQLAVCGGAAIRFSCSSSPVAQNLTASAWETLLGGTSDGIVTVSSQEGAPGGLTQSVAGVIHTSGILNLGFARPTELDGNSADASGDVIDDIIGFLNTPVTQFSPQGVSKAGPFASPRKVKK